MLNYANALKSMYNLRNSSNSPALGKLTLTHGTIATVWATVAIPVGILLTTLGLFVANTFDITQLIQASFTT